MFLQGPKWKPHVPVYSNECNPVVLHQGELDTMVEIIGTRRLLDNIHVKGRARITIMNENLPAAPIPTEASPHPSCSTCCCCCSITIVLFKKMPSTTTTERCTYLRNRISFSSSLSLSFFVSFMFVHENSTRGSRTYTGLILSHDFEVSRFFSKQTMQIYCVGSLT